eukprot:g3213.t1
MKFVALFGAFALCVTFASAGTPLIQQVAELTSAYRYHKTGSNEDDCTRHGNCWDMRLQNVQGCTDGWTLHGLWPQWGESCSREKFDYNEISDLAEQLNQFWPSCNGSSKDFWEHEWSKHGTCSGMSQHDYFSKALSLVQQYRDQCSNLNSGENCDICFPKDLSDTEKCDDN